MVFLKEHILLLILIVAGIGTFLWLLPLRERLQMKWWAVLAFSVLHVLYGVVCVRLFARFEGAGAGSMSIFGAVFFMPIGYFLGAKLFKRPTAEVFDIFSIPMIFTLLCSRVNCLVSGCCYGLQIGNSELHWPTRESEMVFYLLFILITAPKVLHSESGGRVYPLYMAAYGVFRAVNECFRYSATTQNIFHLSHVWALLSAALGFSIYMEMKARKKKTKA